MDRRGTPPPPPLMKIPLSNKGPELQNLFIKYFDSSDAKAYVCLHMHTQVLKNDKKGKNIFSIKM